MSGVVAKRQGVGAAFLEPPTVAHEAVPGPDPGNCGWKQAGSETGWTRMGESPFSFCTQLGPIMLSSPVSG